MQRTTRLSPLVLVLWLALLHLVQPSAIVPVSLRSAESMGTVRGTWTSQDTPKTGKAERRTGLLPAGTRMVRVSTPPSNALLHATRVAGVTAIVRESAPTSSGTHSHAPTWLPLHRLGLPSSIAKCTLALHEALSHRCAALGGALPYYPTAPPLLG